jgi:hypothetical protein
MLIPRFARGEGTVLLLVQSLKGAHIRSGWPAAVARGRAWTKAETTEQPLVPKNVRERSVKKERRGISILTGGHSRPTTLGPVTHLSGRALYFTGLCGHLAFEPRSDLP